MTPLIYNLSVLHLYYFTVWYNSTRSSLIMVRSATFCLTKNSTDHFACEVADIVQGCFLPAQSMDLSLQAIDFLLASSIQDGWPLSDVDWHAGAIVGDDEGDEGDCTFFCCHCSSLGFPGTLTGLDSERDKQKIKINVCDIAAHWDTECKLFVKLRCVSTCSV